MHANRRDWPIEEMANMLGVSRSGYYRYCQQSKNAREQKNTELLNAIRIICSSSNLM